MNGYLFPEFGRDIVMCLASMAICSLAYCLQQWLDKDAQYLKEAIKPSILEILYIKSIQCLEEENILLWPQDLDVLNNITRWREGRRGLSNELMAKLKRVGIFSKPPKNLRKVQISDSAFYSGQSLTNINLEVVFLANGKKKKNIIYRL